MIKKMLSNLYFLFHPSWWYMSYPYNPALDAWINEKLDAGKKPILIDSRFNATIDGITFWIANYPYASFKWMDYRPSRKTIRRAHKILLEGMLPK